MLALLRRLRLPTLVAALVLVTGPAASAACSAAMAAHASEAPTEAPMPMEHSGHDAPPCHDEAPAPHPTPGDDAPAQGDCASVCCVSTASDLALVVSAPSASDVPVPLAAAVLVEAEPEAEPVIPTASPPRPPSRLHVVFERFLI